MGLRIFLTANTLITCCLGSGYRWAILLSPSNGMAGAVGVFWFLVGGFITGFVLGIVLSRTLPDRVLFRACMITGGLAVLLVAVTYFRYIPSAEQAPPQEPKKPTAVPVRMTQQIEQPMGLAKPIIGNGNALYIYMSPGSEELPADIKPADTITFIQKEGYIDIATAPPYLVPEVLKLDYNAFYFRVVSLSRFWIEVVVNKTNGQTAFLDRDAVEYLSWPDFLLNIYSVERLNAEKNPVRARPMDKGSILASGPNLSLKVVAVHAIG